MSPYSCSYSYSPQSRVNNFGMRGRHGAPPETAHGPERRRSVAVGVWRKERLWDTDKPLAPVHRVALWGHFQRVGTVGNGPLPPAKPHGNPDAYHSLQHWQKALLQHE